MTTNNDFKTITGLPLGVIEAIGLALLAFVVCILAWPGMNVPLMLDDIDQLAHAEQLASWKACLGPDAIGLFRPVKNLVFYGFADAPVFQWHLLNLGIYLFSIAGVYWLFRRLLGSPLWALIGATMWATCPTQASTAIWLSCINISLSVALGSLCIALHDKAREGGALAPLTAAGAVILLFLSQCSYEAAVALPALCVLVDQIRKRPLFSRKALMIYGAMAVATLIFLYIRSQTGAISTAKARNYGFSPDLEGWHLTVSAPWFLWRHLSMWLVPVNRIEFCSTYVWGVSASTAELVGGWICLLAILGFVAMAWKRQPWVAFGLVWFLLTSFPSSNFIPLWCGPIEDYYLVFPGIGLTIAVISLCIAVFQWMSTHDATQQNRKWLLFGLIALVFLWRLACIPMFWLQAAMWQRPAELYLRASWTRPAQYQLQGIVARHLLLDEQLDAAKAMALEAQKTGPWYPAVDIVLGCVALSRDELGEAEAHFRKILSEVPEKTPAHDFAILNLALTMSAQPEKRHLVRGLLLPLLNNPASPSHPEAVHAHISNYIAEGKYEDAKRAGLKALHLHPGNSKLLELMKSIDEKSPVGK
jgi:hypothetical protein